MSGNCSAGTIFVPCTGLSVTDVSVCRPVGGGNYEQNGEELPCDSPCAANEFASVACTATTNRVCSPCRNVACGDGLILAACAAGIETSDVSTCTPCATGTYEFLNTCVACSVCGADEFIASDCALARDRVCGTCTWSSPTCGTGYELRSCVGTSFVDVSSCGLCPPGTFENNSVCVACTSCSVNQYESVACTPESDRECSSCELTGCANGLRFTACSGVESEDVSRCTPCLSGMYGVGGVCLPCDSCGENEYVSRVCTGQFNVVCTPCVETACGDGIILTACTGSELQDVSECLVLDDGFYELNDDNIARECRSACAVGEYESAACDPHGNRECERCERQACPADTIATLCAGNESEDTSVCEPCADGQFCIANVSTTCSTCASDQFVARVCTSSSDTVCTDCTWTESTCGDGFDLESCDGMTSEDVSSCGECPAETYEFAFDCHACTVCGSNQYEVVPCSSTSDRQCSDCAVSGCVRASFSRAALVSSGWT